MNHERNRTVLQGRPPIHLDKTTYLVLIVFAIIALVSIIDLEQENKSLKAHVETLQNTCSGM